MPVEHTTAVIGIIYAWTEAGQQPGYKATCTCNARFRKFPQAQKRLAEAQAEDHLDYVAKVARLTGSARGRG